ncbi:hypothetical protein BHM03_00010005 [Ensete ventricosum]|nr:hypothetical protein BHM03_00010005 [Ensete ventricosum]
MSSFHSLAIDASVVATEGTLRELTARSRADRQVRGPKERRCRRRRGPETDAGRRRGTGGGDRGDEDLEAASIDLEIDPRHAIRSNRREIVCEHCGTMRRAFRVLEGAERTKAERGQWRRKPGCFKDLRGRGRGRGRGSLSCPSHIPGIQEERGRRRMLAVRGAERRAGIERAPCTWRSSSGVAGHPNPVSAMATGR